jgi:hypothetical protein
LLHTKKGGPGKKTRNRNETPRSKLRGIQAKVNEGFNLVRFAHNWNNGMLELWNDGLKKTNRKAQIIALLLLF